MTKHLALALLLLASAVQAQEQRPDQKPAPSPTVCAQVGSMAGSVQAIRIKYNVSMSEYLEKRMEQSAKRDYTPERLEEQHRITRAVAGFVWKYPASFEASWVNDTAVRHCLEGSFMP